MIRTTPPSAAPRLSPRPAAPASVRQHFLVPEAAPFVEIRTTLDSALPYAEHFHAAWSFGIILRGSTRFRLDGEEHMAEAGDLVLMAPGQAHSCNPVNGQPRSYHMLLLDAAWLHAQLCAPIGSVVKTVGKAVVRDIPLFRAAVAVVNSLAAGRGGAPAALARILLALQRRHQCFAPPSVKGVKGTKGAKDADGADDAGKQARSTSRATPPPLAVPLYDTSPSVALLARSAGIRRESFSRAVRRQTGLPPSRYMHCLRLEMGRRLLRQGKSIAEAALAAGYTDQSHFHRMFVRFYCVTPGCYRKSLLHRYKK